MVSTGIHVSMHLKIDTRPCPLKNLAPAGAYHRGAALQDGFNNSESSGSILIVRIQKSNYVSARSSDSLVQSVIYPTVPF